MRRNAGVDADGCVVVVAKGTSFKPKVGGWPRQARWREAQHLCSSVLSVKPRSEGVGCKEEHFGSRMPTASSGRRAERQ
jgi:hypothetical protein